MKKVLFLLLLPALLGAADMSAQVTIGGQSEPDKFSLLDIVTTSIKKGVHLPRLTVDERDALISATSEDSIAAKGLAVFNLTTDCYNVWSGKQWLSLCDADMNPLRITTQPAPFTWRRKQDAEGDPNGPASPAAVTLTVVASGSGTLTYAWYKKPKNKNITTHGEKCGSEASLTPDITAWGMHTYYCVVSNGTDSVVSNYADVAVGCGAKTNDGNWLSFMCYNLGADTTLDPFVYYSKGDTISKDIKGWLFQWGRVADGHQWRGSIKVAGPWVNPNLGQVPSADTNFYGKFISNTSSASYGDWSSSPLTMAWNSLKNGPDPCPIGWVVPAISDFASIFGENTWAGVSPENATVNTWLPVTGGYLILPNGADSTLFLPHTGRRMMDATANSSGQVGYYWASAPYTLRGPTFSIGRGPGLVTSQVEMATGFAVRCVKQK